MKIKVYNLEGKETRQIEVSDAVFGVRKNDDLVYQIVTSMQANKRAVLADTKTRGERAGSGIKPWKQKGTGRARVGSVRTPVWRKGGVVFGPNSERNFEKKINKKMNQKAVAVVLSEKLRQEEIKVVEKIELAEKKTKEMAKILKNLEVAGRVLIAYSGDEKDCRIASRNIKKVKNTLTAQLNVLDMLNNKILLMSEESVKYLEEKYNK